MPIKVFGAILVVAAGTLWGFARAEKLAKREKNLISLQTALGLLESEIVFTSNRLRQAFLHIDSICGCESLFSEASENIEVLGISKAWCTAVENQKKSLCFSENDVNILKTLASELGLSDREQQVKNIRRVCALLSQAADDAHSEYRKSAKLYRSMGILGGLFVVLLLF